MAGASLGTPTACLEKEVLGNVAVSLVSFPNPLCRQRHALHIPPAALAQPGAGKGAFSMCYCGEEAALALTLRKMSYRNIQGAFFIARGPGGEAVVMGRDWKLAC